MWGFRACSMRANAGPGPSMQQCEYMIEALNTLRRASKDLGPDTLPHDASS